MSKLAALAKRRAQNGPSPGGNKSVDILNRLTKENGDTKIVGSESEDRRRHPMARVPRETQPEPKPNKESRPQTESSTQTDQTETQKESKHPDPKLKHPDSQQDSKDSKRKHPDSHESSDKHPDTKTSQDSSHSCQDSCQDLYHSVKSDSTLRDSSLLTSPHLFFQNKRPKPPTPNPSLYTLITNNEFPLETIKTAAKNFTAESPDDKVQNAQKQAFTDFKKLDIKDTPVQKVKINQSDILSDPILQKPHKSFVVIGHVDAGKSTMMGRILLDLNVVDLKTVNKLIKESENVGKGSFALAWVMDQTKEERARGVTVDIVATNFDTASTRFTAIDAPGHKDFVPQMINGVCQADLAVLIVDGITGEFESGFQLDGQTKEHTLIARNLGITKIVCVVNKLDKEQWSATRFEFIRSQLVDYLTVEIGFAETDIEFIPASGLTGNNVVKKQALPEFDWYKGPTLLEYLEQVETKEANVAQLLAEPFNLVINEILESNQEFSIRGKILSGVIQTNDPVKFLPVNETLKVSRIKYNDKTIKYSVAGEIIELFFPKKALKEKFDEVMVGDILTNSDMVKSVLLFECNVTLFNLTKPLLVGTPFVLFRNNMNVPAKLVKIVSIENGKKRKHLVSKQKAVVEVAVDSRLLPVSRYEDNEVMGKVVIRREGVTIGAGTVIGL